MYTGLLHPINALDLERCTADEDNHNLTAYYNAVNANKEVVALYTLEYVKLVVEPAVIEFVEDLYPNEGIKDYSIQLSIYSVRITYRSRISQVFIVVSENTIACEVKDEYNN